MSKATDTSRRNFLKVSALVATPAAAMGLPVAALADDGSKAALARMQDERAIEELAQDFLRAFNASGAKGTSKLFANGKAPALGEAVSKLAREDSASDLAIAEDGASATARIACKVDLAEQLEGSETIVQMARLQGNAASIHSASKTLVAQFAKRGDGWVISEVALV